MVKDRSTSSHWKFHGNKTDIVTFIRERERNFVEPQRKGVAKGEPIGFSRDKYAASLYRAVGYSLKEIAKFLGISYGTLRNWSMEEEFKDMVETNQKEFIAGASGHLSTNISDYNWAMDLSPRRKKQIAMDLFSSGLKFPATEALDSHLIISPISGSDWVGPDTDSARKPWADQIRTVVSELKDIVKKPKLTKKDREVALKLVEYLDKTFSGK